MAATVATYCPSRMVEHLNSKSTQPRYSTTRVTLYYIHSCQFQSLYENQLVELPLAGFFLSKLLAQETINIDHLSSLDPELYKNLLYLKTYKAGLLTIVDLVDYATLKS